MEKEESGRKGKIVIFIIALLGALLLWMYAIGYDTEINESLFTGINVELTGLNVNGYTVADSASFSLNIDVRASGTRSLLNNTSASDFRAYVDIAAVSGPGYQTLPVKVIAPNGLTVADGGISVQNVTLFVDTFTSRALRVQIEQTFSSEYTIGRIEQSLYTVNVYGPESVIGNAEAYSSFSLGTITSDTVHVSGEIHLRDASTKAMLNNPYITMDSNTVDVTFVMHGEKNVPITLQLLGGQFRAEDVQFSTSLPGVRLTGPLSELAQVSSLSVLCDETNAENLSGSMTLGDLLKSNLPNGTLSVYDAESELSYTVVLPEVLYKTVTVPASQITVYGMPENDGRRVTVKELEVRIFGSAAAVEAYDVSNMTVRVNYEKLILQMTGDYIGPAEISTGDSGVCTDGKAYSVSVRLDGGGSL